MKRTVAAGDPASARRGRPTLFAASIVAVVCASLFAGAMLRPAVERWRAPHSLTSGDLALFLEHAQVDVRLGRAGPLAERLAALARTARDPAIRERILALWTEAAVQAGSLADAATAEAEREAAAPDPVVRTAARLRRIALSAAMGRPADAAELAKPFLEGPDPRLADEARLRLAAGAKTADLRAWVAKQDLGGEEARRAGMVALRLLGDPAQAERLLAPLDRASPCDASLCAALIEVYSKLDRPTDLARIAGDLAQRTTDEGDRARLTLMQADALSRAGDTAGALAAIEPLQRSPVFLARRGARRSRYEFLFRAGRLDGELRSLRDPAERAFVALEIQHDYAEAVRLYRLASTARQDSAEIAEGASEAARRLDLRERQELYERVLAKDPQDRATRDKLVSALVALGDPESQRHLRAVIQDGSGAETLVAVAQAFQRAGLPADAVAYLRQALTTEPDPVKKQQLLFALGDLYAEARQDEEARRLFTGLAAEGSSVEIRERAVARLTEISR